MHYGRERCAKCYQPLSFCYCSQLRPFDPGVQFVILIHPVEWRRRIATGRMTHLTLKNSVLIRGQEFSNHYLVNEIISDPQRQCFVLYPGRESLNLSQQTATATDCFDQEKTCVVFVIDGTWGTARKMLRLSPNIKALPRLSFDITGPSRFRVRKQPKNYCYSTIEAVDRLVQLLPKVYQTGQYDQKNSQLISVFDFLVEQQINWRSHV